MTNRNPRSISTTVCLTLPPLKQRVAPSVRLARPEAMAASWSALGRSRWSDTATGNPSAETTMAWATPGVALAKLPTSQLRLWASGLSCGISPLSGSVVGPLGDIGAPGHHATALDAGAVAGQHAADLVWGACGTGLGLTALVLLGGDDHAR